MNEDLQPDFDQEKYERFIHSQVNNVLSSFEERVYLIMRHYPAYDLNAAMELDTADAISMAKSALISEYQSSMMLMSVSPVTPRVRKARTRSSSLRFSSSPMNRNTGTPDSTSSRVPWKKSAEVM